MGFVRTAIRSGVPIVPVATVGGHDTVFVLSEGRWLANGLDRVSGLKKKRLSSRFGGDSSVRERDLDAGAAEVDHGDQGVC